MAVLTRDETSEPIKDTRTRAQRLRDKAAAKTEPHDRAETDLGQALKDAEAPPELPIDVPEQPVEAQVSAQRVIQITCGVARKIAHNYNSTEYRCGATIEITDGSDPETVAGQTYDMLRQIIRDQFNTTKGQNTNGSTPKG